MLFVGLPGRFHRVTSIDVRFGPRRWPNGPDRSAVPSCDIVPRETPSLGKRAATSAFALLSRGTANLEEQTHGEPDTSRTDRDEFEPLPNLRERARADRLPADLSRRHHAAGRRRAGAEGSRFLAQTIPCRRPPGDPHHARCRPGHTV